MATTQAGQRGRGRPAGRSPARTMSSVSCSAAYSRCSSCHAKSSTRVMPGSTGPCSVHSGPDEAPGMSARAARSRSAKVRSSRARASSGAGGRSRQSSRSAQVEREDDGGAGVRTPHGVGHLDRADLGGAAGPRGDGDVQSSRARGSWSRTASRTLVSRSRRLVSEPGGEDEPRGLGAEARSHHPLARAGGGAARAATAPRWRPRRRSAASPPRVGKQRGGVQPGRGRRSSDRHRPRTGDDRARLGVRRVVARPHRVAEPRRGLAVDGHRRRALCSRCPCLGGLLERDAGRERDVLRGRWSRPSPTTAAGLPSMRDVGGPAGGELPGERVPRDRRGHRGAGAGGHHHDVRVRTGERSRRCGRPVAPMSFPPLPASGRNQV